MVKEEAQLRSHQVEYLKLLLGFAGRFLVACERFGYMVIDYDTTST